MHLTTHKLENTVEAFKGMVFAFRLCSPTGFIACGIGYRTYPYALLGLYTYFVLLA